MRPEPLQRYSVTTPPAELGRAMVIGHTEGVGQVYKKYLDGIRRGVARVTDTDDIATISIPLQQDPTSMLKMDIFVGDIHDPRRRLPLSILPYGKVTEEHDIDYDSTEAAMRRTLRAIPLEIHMSSPLDATQTKWDETIIASIKGEGIDIGVGFTHNAPEFTDNIAAKAKAAPRPPKGESILIPGEKLEAFLNAKVTISRRAS